MTSAYKLLLYNDDLYAFCITIMDYSLVEKNNDIIVEWSNTVDQCIEKTVWSTNHSVFQNLNTFENLSFVDKEKDFVRCCYSDDISKYPILSEKEIIKLFHKYKKLWNNNSEWIKVRNQIVNANLRYVYKIAKHIYSWLKELYNFRDLNLNDLIQAWNIWLMHAVSGYSPRKWKSFFTYFKPMIGYTIYNYIKCEARYFGSSPSWSAKQFRLFIENFNNLNWRNPNINELQNFIDEYNEKNNTILLSTDYWYFYENYLLKGVISLDQPLQWWITQWNDNEVLWSDGVFMLENYNSDDNNLYEDDETTLKDVLVDSTVNSADRWAYLESLKNELNQVLSLLTWREKDVLTFYFWLDWSTPMSLDEIAFRMWYTRERIRQIKERALKKLKGSIKTSFSKYFSSEWYNELLLASKADVLKQYLEDSCD